MLAVTVRTWAKQIAIKSIHMRHILIKWERKSHNFIPELWPDSHYVHYKLQNDIFKGAPLFGV